MMDPSVAILLLIVWWLTGSFAVALAAGKRGRDRGPWFFVSLFLGPIFAILLLIAHPIELDDETEESEAAFSITGRHLQE